MIKVKTFTAPITTVATPRGFAELDRDIAAFLAAEKARTVLAMSDATTSGDSGQTVGLIRSIAYEVD